MASNFSFKELATLYSQKGKEKNLLFKETNPLPGLSTQQKLEKLYFSRQSGSLPSVPKDWPNLNNQKVIAICLIIVDELYHEDIWRYWVESGDGKEFEAKLFIHAKHPERIKSEWVKKHTLEETFKPEWNSLEVVKAMLLVLKKATDYKVQENHDFKSTGIDSFKVCGRFIFCTESCIPLYDLQETGKILFKEEQTDGVSKSWVNAYKTPKSKWESANCFLSVNPNIIPQRAVWKAIPGWIMLTRKHSLEILSLIEKTDGKNAFYPTHSSQKQEKETQNSGKTHTDSLISAWGTGGPWESGSGVFAPEEVFFPTMLALLGYLNQNNSDQIEVRKIAVNFAVWEKIGDANPIQFSSLTKELLIDLRGVISEDEEEKRRGFGACFGRKFSKNSVSLSCWKRIVLQDTDGVEDRLKEGGYEQKRKGFRLNSYQNERDNKRSRVDLGLNRYHHNYNEEIVNFKSNSSDRKGQRNDHRYDDNQR